MKELFKTESLLQAYPCFYSSLGTSYLWPKINFHPRVATLWERCLILGVRENGLDHADIYYFWLPSGAKVQAMREKDPPKKVPRGQATNVHPRTCPVEAVPTFWDSFTFSLLRYLCKLFISYQGISKSELRVKARSLKIVTMLTYFLPRLKI